VDGGFLVTQGVYTGIEDYNKTVVRQLMVWILNPSSPYLTLCRLRDG
jgi:hypothetical protein